MPRPDYIADDYVLNAVEIKVLKGLLDALKPGIYVKCSRCLRFGQTTEISWTDSETLCAECA